MVDLPTCAKSRSDAAETRFARSNVHRLDSRNGQPLSCTTMKSTPVIPAAEPGTQGSASAQALFPALYRELKRLARSRLAAGGRPTLLDTSSLVHEAFLRMQRSAGPELKDREHLLAYAATTMRSIIVDFIRRRSADRRGGDQQRITLNTAVADQLGHHDAEILEIHEALEALRAVEPTLVQVVEMRYFAGLEEAEVATALGVTDRTVRRYWERARLMLREILRR